MNYFGKFFLKRDENYCSKKREIEIEIKDINKLFYSQIDDIEKKLRVKNINQSTYFNLNLINYLINFIIFLKKEFIRNI